MITFDNSYWALIIGGSSGFGLAAARKLAAQGMNLCIVHRDRKGAMSRIEPLFNEIRATGVSVLTFNIDALSEEGRTSVLDGLSDQIGRKGKIRMVLHSVALGNLKLLVPDCFSDDGDRVRNKLAEQVGVFPEAIGEGIRSLFDAGEDRVHSLADPPAYENDLFLTGADFLRTIEAMGSNLLEWVRDIYSRKMFAGDARVLGLTSEGNRIAWRGYAAVSAAKAVLESISRSMAVEMASYGIRSNVIQAGVTETAALRAIPGNRHIRAKAFLRNPFGRLTRPEDVADVICLLCTDEAAWINGTLIRVDGGESIG